MQTVYTSGQIALDPQSGQLVDGGIEAQAEQVFRNLRAVAQASGGTLDDAVKLTLFLTDLGHFGIVNEAMQRHPARSTVGVASLPRGALFEAEAVLILPNT